MPDTCRTSVCIEATVLRPGPTTQTIKIHTAFHQTVFKIKHSIDCIPWAHGISCIGSEMTVDGSQSGGSHSAKRHLVSAVGNYFLMCDCICCAGNGAWFQMIESIIISDGEIL